MKRLNPANRTKKILTANPNNQVASKASGILATLPKHFGLQKSVIDAAMNGDIPAAQSIGERAKTARIQSEFAPLVAQQVVSVIQGVEAVNSAHKQIIDAAKVGSLNIQTMQAGAALSEQNFGHTQAEKAGEYIAARGLETVRHNNALSNIQMKAYIDHHNATMQQHIRQVTDRSRFDTINNNVTQKQIDSDREYNKQAGLKWLETGNRAEVDLVQNPQYASSPINRAKSVLNDIKSALGF